MKLSRRWLLGASGASLALPFLESLYPSRAFAAGMPTRLLVFVTHEGTILPRWMPAPGPLTASMSQLLQPLAPLRQKLTVLSGLNNKVAGLCNSNGHNASSRTLLSAHLTASAADASGHLKASGSQTDTTPSTGSIGPSFDQSIAAALGVNRTMNVCIGSPAETRMFYQTAPAVSSQTQGARAEVDQFDDAVAAFNTYLAPNLSTGGVMDAGVAPRASFADRLTARRPRVLDTVHSSLGALKTKVSAADRLRLEQHEASIERFEAGLPAPAAMDAGTAAPPTQACHGQSLPANYSNRSADYEAYYRAQLDVLVNGLACGVSRVASFQDHDMYSPPFGNFLASPNAGLSGLGAVPFPAMQSDWHSNVHGAGGGGVGDRENNGSLNAGFTFYASMFRYLLGQMDAIVEPNGKTLLDNSLVVWLSEFGDGGSHATLNLPAIIAGSNGGRFTTGRHVALNNASTSSYPGPNQGRTTNDLFVSLHRQMGITSVNQFGYTGDASLNTGGIAELEH